MQVSPIVLTMQCALLLYFLEFREVLTEDYKRSQRIKRVVDKPPPPKTTTPIPTSEELRERKWSTESPHLYDYPDAIYKNPEIQKGEWNRNPIPKKRTKNVTVAEKGTQRNGNVQQDSEDQPRQLKAPLSNILGTAPMRKLPRSEIYNKYTRV